MDLADSLLQRTLESLSRRGHHADPALLSAVLHGCESLDSRLVEDHFAHLRRPDRYLSDFAPAAIRQHLRLLHELRQGDPVAVAVEASRNLGEFDVTVAGLNFLGVTACVTGSLAELGLSISDLEILTYDDDPAAGAADDPPAAPLANKFVMVVRVQSDSSELGDDELRARLTPRLKAAYWHLARGDVRRAWQEIDDTDPKAGQVLGDRFRLERSLAEGAMGKVYLATQLGLNRPVIIKLLKEELSDDEKFVESFRREAHLLAQADSPWLVKVYDFGVHEFRHWMALEYITGGDIGHWLMRMGPPSTDLAVQWLLDALRGLRYIHDELGLVHCDVKPGNLLLDSRHNLKLGDLGLSQLWRLQQLLGPDGSVKGTPLYMAPEQARGEALDFRTDLYSLGSTFLHILTGRPPYEATSNAQLISLVARGVCRGLDDLGQYVPAPLAVVIDRLMRADRWERYQSAAVALADLESYLTRGPLSQLDRTGKHRSAAADVKTAVSTTLLPVRRDSD
jgi:hypothetical protein